MNLPLLHWIPKLHKNTYKQRFIAGSSNCSTKALSKLLTSVLTTVKEGLQKYCDVVYSHSGINQMWILKNSKQLLENLQSQSSHINSIRTFDFSTLYTTIPHDKLKSRLCNIIRQAFRFKNGKNGTNILLSVTILLILLKTTRMRNTNTQKTTLLG